MVLGGTEPRDLIAVRLLCLDLLTESSQSRYCDEHQSAFHGLTPLINSLRLREAYGRPGYPDLPVRRTTCRPPALASEPWASAWSHEAQASRPSLPPARTRTLRDESADFGRDRRSSPLSSSLA